MLSLAVAAVSLAYVAPLSAPSSQGRMPAVQMAASKKVIQMENMNGGLFEARETNLRKPPVYLLSRLEELKAATTLSEVGLLSLAEKNKVFSSLESAGAFSTVEKLLPTIEKLGLLTFIEESLDTPNGNLFTLANTLLFFPFGLLMLQGFAFLPSAEGIFIPLELLTDLVAFSAGAALFVLAYGVSLLQGD